jgi:4-hydroxy-tetrahydrodipicolinate reductase
MTPERVGVLHVGLGEVGVGVAELVASRDDLQSAGAVDIRPELAGVDLGSLLVGGHPRHQPAVTVRGTIADALEQRPDVAVVATVSTLAGAASQVLECVRAGVSVVSTCPELSFPWKRSPDLAQQIDAEARSAGVSVVGTGINPGFSAEYLVAVLAMVCGSVHHVRVSRSSDLTPRMPNTQRASGAGLSLDAFADAVAAGRIGHPWLEESGYHIARVLGWELSNASASAEPVVAREGIETPIGNIDAGAAAGVRYQFSGHAGDDEVLSIANEYSFGADNHDEIEIDADDPVRFCVPGGFHGDRATARVVTNTLRAIPDAPPGLIRSTDLRPAPPLSA